ncbi:MAG: sulfotransferase domain-containing protein [Acidimicrobiales bacterium]
MGDDARDLLNKNFVWNAERWHGFAFRDDDIVISTAPKCGTTWMQMQCALLVFRTPDLPAPLATLSPWLDMNTRPLDAVLADLEAQTHRRFIKTHTALGDLPWDERVTYVHVGRDPRDAALSWDNHMANLDFERFVEARAAAVGLDDLAELGMEDDMAPPPEDPALRFWDWVEGSEDGPGPSGLARVIRHSGSFWDARDRPNVHLFHYAEQRDDLAREMGRLADALGVAAPTEALVDAARFESMKARADELVPNSDTPFWQSSSQFFDKARAGDWRALIGADGGPRYAAAVQAATDDGALVEWLHGGPVT